MKRYLMTAVFALGLYVVPPAATAETLTDALVSGYTSSGLLTQNRALLRAADEDVAQAVAALRPIISWTADASSTSGNPVIDDRITAVLELSAELTVFDGGSLQTTIGIQEETVLATRARLLGVEQDVLLRIVNAYFDVREALQLVALQTSNLELIQQELNSARIRFNIGEITRTDISLAEARLAAAGSDLAVAQGDLIRANEEYRAAVGRQPETLQNAGLMPLSYSLDEGREIALLQHPDILEAQHRLDAAQLGIHLAQAAVRPTGTLRGEVETDQDFERGGSLTLRIEGPIYNGGALSGGIRRAQAERDQSRAILRVATQNAYQNITNAYTNLTVVKAEIAASIEQVRAARVALAGTREEALLGSRTILDVLDARQDLLVAESNLISAQINEARTRYALLEAMGLLTADALGLPVETYDKSAYFNQVRNAPAAISDQGRALDRVLESIGQN